MSDIKGKTIYQVRFGRVTKLTAISETKQGYKAQTKNGHLWQVWKNKRFSGYENFRSAFYVEKCFLCPEAAIKYAREQIMEMEVHHRCKSDDYLKASAKITIEE